MIQLQVGNANTTPSSLGEGPHRQEEDAPLALAVVAQQPHVPIQLHGAVDHGEVQVPDAAAGPVERSGAA
eukprot:3349235-Pyramimonas_sp.AAC.1